MCRNQEIIFFIEYVTADLFISKHKLQLFFQKNSVWALVKSVANNPLFSIQQAQKINLLILLQGVSAIAPKFKLLSVHHHRNSYQLEPGGRRRKRVLFSEIRHHSNQLSSDLYQVAEKQT